MRDKELDIFRAIAIIEVIIQHCCYWTGIYSTGEVSIVKSLIVLGFAMPLFFVITGASNFLSSKNNIMDFYKSRLQRIIVPYWIYAVVCIVISYYYLRNNIDIFQMIGYWIIPINKQIVFNPLLGGALWFIPIYLFTMILFPLLKKYYKFYCKKSTILLTLAIFLMTIMILSYININNTESNYIYFYYIKMVVFYMLFIYIGIVYIDRLKTLYIKKRWLIIVIIGFLLIDKFLINLGMGSWNMQINKFPPNIVFLMQGLMWMTILFVLRKNIVNITERICKNRICNFIFESYRDNCYSIYLFHPIIFVILSKIIIWTNMVDYLNKHNGIYLLLYIIITIPISAILGKYVSIIERIKINIKVIK